MLAVVRLLTRGKRAASSQRAAEAARRRVWRITDSKPEGEWVDTDADSSPPRGARDDERTTLTMDSWATSSMDLRDGMHVVEFDEPPGEDGGPRPH